MHIVSDTMRFEGGHGAVIWSFTNVVPTWSKKDSVVRVAGDDTEGDIIERDIPVPQESISATRSLYGSFFAMAWKTPSAMVDLQMLPRQTKRTEIFSAMFAIAMTITDGEIHETTK